MVGYQVLDSSSGDAPDVQLNATGLLELSFCCSAGGIGFLPNNFPFCYVRKNITKDCFGNTTAGSVTWQTESEVNKDEFEGSHPYYEEPIPESIRLFYCCGTINVTMQLPSTTGVITSGVITSGSIASSLQSENTSSGSNGNKGLIAAISILGSIFVIVILFVVAYVVFKRKKTNKPRELAESQQDPLDIETLETKRSSKRSSLLLSPMWEINYSDLRIQMPPIGSGSFGVVNKATYNGSTVAVKTFYQRVEIEEFEREVALLSTLRHPSIILFMGACSEPMAVVTEFAERGSVYDILKKTPDDITVERAESMAIDCARGMAYLHRLNPPVIHRDLKTPNLLVDSAWKVKIADFGISRAIGSVLTMTKSVGTPRWSAPELLDPDSKGYSEKVDVYAYGMILWELFHKKTPFEDIEKPSALEKAVLGGERPEISESVPEKFKVLMIDCWKQDPTQRSSFIQILKVLAPSEEIN